VVARLGEAKILRQNCNAGIRLPQSGPQGTCFLLCDKTVRTHSYLLLIIFAVGLFFFLSHKIVVLLKIQVYFLADPIVPIRKVNNACIS